MKTDVNPATTETAVNGTAERVANGRVLLLGQIAERIGGRLDGDPELHIHGVNGIREARAGELTFLANDRYSDWINKTQATAVIVRESFTGSGKPLIRVGDPESAIQSAVQFFAKPPV